VKRMSKMEAVGVLCELKVSLEDELERHRKWTDDDLPLINPVDHKRYRDRQITQLERQIRGLEMAGSAMTR